MKSIFKHIIVSILTWEAQMVLRRHGPKIIAVTGSVGKTSTKDAIFTLIAHSYFARKSEKSFNSELGVPLTVLGLPTAWTSPLAWFENIMEGLMIALFSRTYPEWLVLEVGADRPGDIKKLAWLAPHGVVFTHFPDVPVHVEYFESAEEVMAEKRELKVALRENGTLIVNADDPNMASESVREGQRVMSYGMSEKATVRMVDMGVLYENGMPCGMTARVQFQQETFPLTLRGTLGAHQLYPLLAALAVGVSEGWSFEKVVEALVGHTTPPGRMRLLSGKNDSCIIDDTYNASPAAVLAGLQALASVGCRGKKIVVLGDMMELGEFSIPQHRLVGERVASVCDVFVAVGVRMQRAAEMAHGVQGTVSQIVTVKDTKEAIAVLRELVADGDMVYVKGSQSMRMERIVEELLHDPSRAPALLVRQDAEWKKR